MRQKTEFSRVLGFIDPDHYTGAENDKAGKEPSRQMLEKAAQAAGFAFTDCIQLPNDKMAKLSKEHDKVHRKLQDLLDAPEPWPTVAEKNVESVHLNYERSRRKRKKKT